MCVAVLFDVDHSVLLQVCSLGYSFLVPPPVALDMTIHPIKNC